MTHTPYWDGQMWWCLACDWHISGDERGADRWARIHAGESGGSGTTTQQSQVRGVCDGEAEGAGRPRSASSGGSATPDGLGEVGAGD